MENEQESQEISSGSMNVGKFVLVAVAAIYFLGSIYFMYDMSGRIDKLDAQQRAAVQSADLHNKAIMDRLGMTESNLKESAGLLQSKLTKAQREAAVRAAELRKEQEQTAQQLQQSQQQLSSVSTDLGGVKTELTGARGDISATRTDL